MNDLGIVIVVPDRPMRIMAETIAETYNRSITEREHIDGQVICVGEEAGEFLGAYRRYTGRARRSGTREEMLDEMADVIVGTLHAAWLLGVNDIQEVIDHKIGKVFSRGWKN